MRFNDTLRDRGCSASTRAKHLRVLSACLGTVFYRYAASNPVRELHPAQKPRPERKEAAYFENAELPRLFATSKRAVQDLVPRCAQDRHAQGEISRFVGGTSTSSKPSCGSARAYTGGELGTPKNRERRDVDLISDVVELLGWLAGRARRHA